MLKIEDLAKIAVEHENELRDYRLTGDLNLLLIVVNSALSAYSNNDFNKIREDFFNALTHNEEIAFTAIREEIGSFGNISVVKMIQKTGLSRPVWTSLLQKMEKFGIARIKNQGVKGTNIEILGEIE